MKTSPVFSRGQALWMMAVVFLWVSGCSANVETKQQPVPDYLTAITVPSLRALYPAFLAEAQKWDADADLEKVTIDLFQVSEELGEVSAIFHSPNRPMELFFVDYFLDDGTMVNDIIELDFPHRNFHFVRYEDLIDSTEAWQIFLQQPEVLAHAKEDFECAKLILIRNVDATRLSWRLALGGLCGDTDLTFYYVDAYTGEFRK